MRTGLASLGGSLMLAAVASVLAGVHRVQLLKPGGVNPPAWSTCKCCGRNGSFETPMSLLTALSSVFKYLSEKFD